MCALLAAWTAAPATVARAPASTAPVATTLVVHAPPTPTLRSAPGPTRAGDVWPGRWSRDDVPAGWVLVESDHYQVQSQVGEPKARRLADHLETRRPLYAALAPSRRATPRFVVKVFDDFPGFRAYDPDMGAVAAYYDPEHRELVAYDTGLLLGTRDVGARIRLTADFGVALDAEEEHRVQTLFERATDTYLSDVAGSLAHEGWHQYLDHFLRSEVPLPAWIDEGVADWFGAARPADGGVTTGAVHPRRLRTARRALVEGELAPLADLLTFTHKDYYRRASVYYAQGWALVHFLLVHEDDDTRELVPRLIEELRRAKDPEAATARVFADVDIGMLEREWKVWLRRQDVDDPLEKLAREFGDVVHPRDLVAPEHWRDMYAFHRERAQR